METVIFEIKRAERNFWAILSAIALSLLFAASCNAQTATEWETLKGDVNLFVANDLGRNGYYDQKPIAELMGEMADVIGPEAIIATGDVHHFVLLAPTIFFTILAGGETAILKGLGKLKSLAAQAFALSLLSLLVSVPVYGFLRRCLGFGTIRYPWSLQCLDSHRSVSRAEVLGQLLRVLSRSL